MMIRHLLLTMLLVLSAPTAEAAERWEMLPPTPAPIAADRTGKVDANGISIHYAALPCLQEPVKSLRLCRRIVFCDSGDDIAG
jgi:hypothetical protein